MAFPNTLFPCIPLQTDLSDEEYNMFHTTDRKLVSTLIHSLNRNLFDSINVVAFLLWLERNGLSVNAVYKVNLDWPDHLVDVLADQVVAFLVWLENPTLVWEMCGDIYLIQKLCNQNVGFEDLHGRRLDILKGKMEIVNEMCDRAFKDAFPGGFEDKKHVGSEVGGEFVHHSRELSNGIGFVLDTRGIENKNIGVGFAAGPAYDPQEIQNNNCNGVGTEIGGSFYNDPRELMNRNHTGVGLGNASGFLHGARELDMNNLVRFAGGPFHDPQEPLNKNQNGVEFELGPRFINEYPRELMNNNYNNAGFGMPSGLVHGTREFKNKHVVGFAAGPAHHPQELQNYNHNGAEVQFGARFTHDHRELRITNHNGVAFGSVSGLNGHREHENLNGGRFSGGFKNDKFVNNGPILPDVVVGPRMGRNMRNSQGYEVGSTSVAGSMTKNQVRDPISEHELSVLLSGLNITEEETDVPFDDRTVFLTFSKGYPVTESEIWNFFTRKFGNFIKGIHFEEVQEGMQPLYARMVALNTSILPLICDVTTRTKYIVNGKHVWARKYVRNRNTPPPRLSSSTTNPPQN